MTVEQQAFNLCPIFYFQNSEQVVQIMDLGWRQPQLPFSVVAANNNSLCCPKASWLILVFSFTFLHFLIFQHVSYFGFFRMPIRDFAYLRFLLSNAKHWISDKIQPLPKSHKKITEANENKSSGDQRIL